MVKMKKKSTSYYVSCLLVQKKKPYLTQVTQPFRRLLLQKGRNFPNHKRGKKKIKKERKKPSKVVGAAAPWNLFFFFSCGDLSEEIEEPYYLCSPRFSVDSPNWLPPPGWDGTASFPVSLLVFLFLSSIYIYFVQINSGETSDLFVNPFQFADIWLLLSSYRCCAVELGSPRGFSCWKTRLF